MDFEKSPFYRKVRRLEIQAARLVENRFAGSYRSVFRGPGLEFDEVREYVPGDDVRMIDWNVTSRFGTPYTKVFREERELTLFVIVDVSASLLAGSGPVGKQEQACLISAVLALSAEMNNDRVGALLFSDRVEGWIPPARGRTHVLRLINDLLHVRPEGRGSDLALALRLAGKHLKRRGICLVLSDFRTEGYWEPLGLLARRHDCVAVKITDPADTEYPSGGLFELEDPENGQVLMADGASPAFRDSWRRFWGERHRTWLRECRRRGVETLRIDTTDDPGRELLRFFQARKRRAHGRA